MIARSADGTRVHVNVSAVRMSDQGSDTICWLLRDMSESFRADTHARLVQELRAANETKADFISVLSHEFHTPLTSIIGYADILQTATPPDAREAEHLRRISASAWHLCGLVDQILTFGRAEAGREDVALQFADAAIIARMSVDMVKPMAEEKGVRLEAELPPGRLETMTDAGKLRQILLNLLSNAVKFTDPAELKTVLEIATDG
jgi:signal transduction histidine kinase